MRKSMRLALKGCDTPLNAILTFRTPKPRPAVTTHALWAVPMVYNRLHGSVRLALHSIAQSFAAHPDIQHISEFKASGMKTFFTILSMIGCE